MGLVVVVVVPAIRAWVEEVDMAMLDDVDRRLHQWARWVAGGNAGGLGYASISYDGVRGASGDGPVIPTIAVEASADHDDVMRLPSELRRTVEVYYLGTTANRAVIAVELACSVSTVDARLTRAHLMLRDAFAERSRRNHEMREEARKRYLSCA